MRIRKLYFNENSRSRFSLKFCFSSRVSNQIRSGVYTHIYIYIERENTYGKRGICRERERGEKDLRELQREKTIEERRIYEKSEILERERESTCNPKTEAMK